MARIRSIKPEFPQSESIGALSRDARLLFIQLWTIVDDDGRARASSRMLASLLYPYDDDARGLIDGWLDELERHHCIRRYKVEGSSYLDIPKWLTHQKIDHPSKSKLPPFREPSRALANVSEVLAPDLDRIGKERKDAEADASAPRPIEKPGSIIITPEYELFRRGKEVLGQSAGGLIKQLLAAKGNVPLARAAIEHASIKENPREYIVGAIRNADNEEHQRRYVDPRL